MHRATGRGTAEHLVGLHSIVGWHIPAMPQKNRSVAEMSSHAVSNCTQFNCWMPAHLNGLPW